MAEKRAASSSWQTGAAKKKEELLATSAAPAMTQLLYRCTDCRRVETLDETSAAICRNCSWRILVKESRAPTRSFSTE